MSVPFGANTSSPSARYTAPPFANLFGIVVSILYGAPNVLTPSPPAILLRRPLVLPGRASSFMFDLPDLSTTGWLNSGTEPKAIDLPCCPAIFVAAIPIAASICAFNEIIFALA